MGTITIGYDWSLSSRVAPWRDGFLDMSVEYKVPTADKCRTCTAIYSSWTIGLASQNGSSFVWYETALFDLERPLGGDVVFMDTISGRPIIHSPLSFGEISHFHSLLPDSAPSSSEPIREFQRFHFSIEAQHVVNAMTAANSKYNLTLSEDPAEWYLVHTNVELEGTSGGAAGHSLRNMIIAWNASAGARPLI